MPSPSELRRHLLRLLQDEKSHNLSEVKETIAKRLDISENERKKMSAKRGRPIYDARVVGALSSLRKAGLVNNERKGVFKLTRAGVNESKKY